MINRQHVQAEMGIHWLMYNILTHSMQVKSDSLVRGCFEIIQDVALQLEVARPDQSASSSLVQGPGQCEL